MHQHSHTGAEHGHRHEHQCEDGHEHAGEPGAGHDHDHAGASHDAGDSHAHGHAGHHHGPGGHSHGAGVTDERLVVLAFGIIVVFLVVEVVGGLLSGSLALLADAGHMVSDAAALGFSWFALRVGRRQATEQLSYGYRRMEILAAFVNGLALFLIALWIVAVAIERFFEPVAVMGVPMLIVACAGLAANIAAFLVLNGGSRDSLNMRSALLHVLGDMLGSAAAIVAALVIMGTGWVPIDPILSVFVALIVLRGAWQIIRSSGHILLEGTPAGISIADIKADLEQNVAQIRDAHHIHVWSITSGQHLLTVHVVPSGNAQAHEVVAAVRKRVAERYDITHVTVQIEEDGCCDADKAAERCCG